MYLQAQLKNTVIGWLSTASFLLDVLFCWIFVTKLDLGVTGAMGSLNIYIWLVIGEFVYVFGGWCPNTWKGFTKAAFVDIFAIIKLSISSGVMLCALELWYSSILVLLAGYMKDASVAISAFSICLSVSELEFMICLGFLGASCVRVSNELGNGNAKAAKFSIKVILFTSTSLGVICFVLCLVFGRQLSYLFTTSEEVAESISNLYVVLAFSLFLNSIQSVITGVAIGAGLQSVVAYINLGSYYVIGIPAAVLLGYVANFGIKGLWVGLLCEVMVQTIILSYFAWTDWNEQINKASEHLNKWFLRASEEFNQSSTDA